MISNVWKSVECLLCPINTKIRWKTLTNCDKCNTIIPGKFLQFHWVIPVSLYLLQLAFNNNRALSYSKSSSYTYFNNFMRISATDWTTSPIWMWGKKGKTGFLFVFTSPKLAYLLWTWLPKKDMVLLILAKCWGFNESQFQW